MVLMVAAALMVGFFATIIADQRANGIDRDQTQAYAAAHAGLEKLTSAMATLFVTDYSPSKVQIDRIIAKPPVIPGFDFIAPGGAAGSGYMVTYKAETDNTKPTFGDPVPDDIKGTPITAGPYAGFKGIITKYPITITARSKGGAEVRLRRELQTVGVPVYQFGVFSETDLTFYAGDDFNFGGRVQTNGNLFLSEVTGKTLTLSDRVTAFKDVIRSHLSNGKVVTDVNFDGTVNVLNTTTGVGYRNLVNTEGSLIGMPGSAPRTGVSPQTGPSWTTISTGYYKSLLRNGLTGAKYLSLPLVSQGAQPVDLIRRPPLVPAIAANAENLTNAIVFGQRYFSLGYPDSGPSLRILLSDTAAEITGLPTVTATAPVPLDGTATAAQYSGALGGVKTPHVSPLAKSPGVWTANRGLVTASTYSAPPAFSTVTVGAGLPAYFKLPSLTITQGANVRTLNCTGRSLTQFLACVPTAGVLVNYTAGPSRWAPYPLQQGMPRSLARRRTSRSLVAPPRRLLPASSGSRG
jgi:hypothetical protein